jgi:hypothetical protein
MIEIETQQAHLRKLIVKLRSRLGISRKDFKDSRVRNSLEEPTHTDVNNNKT